MAHVRDADVVAIDAPLLPICDDRKRCCERLFARGAFQRRCKPGFSHVKGTGQALRKAGFSTAGGLRALAPVRPQPVRFPLVFAQSSIVEAFPNAFLGVCIGDDIYACMPPLKRGEKFDWLYTAWCQSETFQAFTQQVSFLPESFVAFCKTNLDHEERAALICLATAASVANTSYTAIGDPEGGYFFLPPWQLWANWSRAEIDIQRRKDPSIAVWIDGVLFRAEDRLP